MNNIKNISLNVLTLFLIFIIWNFIWSQIKIILWINETFNNETKQYEICSIINRQLNDKLNNNNIWKIWIFIKEENNFHFLLVDKNWKLYDNSFYLIWKINLNDNNYQKIKNILWNEYHILIKYVYFNNYDLNIYWNNTLEKIESFYLNYLQNWPFIDLYYKYFIKNKKYV